MFFSWECRVFVSMAVISVVKFFVMVSQQVFEPEGSTFTEAAAMALFAL